MHDDVKAWSSFYLCLFQEAGQLQVLLVSASRRSKTPLGRRTGALARHTPPFTRHQSQDVPVPATATATQSSMFH